ncbi:hypothetical protein RP20_CCG012097 [Aedes albopictus]|nr:hypothetical protein RP20_CCG012097 [Aedes albopictus]
MSKAHFAVVQTQEAQGPMLSVVPHQWVQKDGLLWPNKNAHTLSKDASSKPSHTWTKIPCVVKKKNIATYEKAQQEAAELSGLSTDTSDFAPRKKQKRVHKSQPAQGYDFNDMLSQAGPSSASQPQPGVKHLVISRKSMVPRQTPPSFVMKAVTSKPAPGPTQLAIGQSPAQLEQVPATHAMAHSASIIPVTPSVPVAAAVDMHQIVEQSEVSLLSASEVEVLLQNSQEVGLESQVAEEEVSYHEEYVENYDEEQNSEKRIVQAIEQASDRIIEAVARKMDESFTKSVAAIKSDFDLKIEAALRVRRHDNDTTDQNFKFSPASTVQEIEQLETELANTSYQEKLITHMRKMIGPIGDTCNGQNMCYALIDRFFQRCVMTSCSWSGGSKSDVPKYPMKNCKHILDTFFKIVHAVNSTFSVKLMEDFFKQVLRNAKSRCQAKGLRQSTIHRRAKNSKQKNTQGK